MARGLAVAMALTLAAACTDGTTAQSPGPRATAVGTPSATTLTPTSTPDDPATTDDTAAPTPSPTAGGPGAASLGRFDEQLGVEISGVAAARAVDGLWLVDDQPGTDRVHLVALDGSLLASVTMTGVTTVNPEDLAVGPCPLDGDRSCVHVADIGDNVAGRADVVVVSFPEDVVTAGTSPTTTAVAPTVRRLVWDDGPRDAEALAVLADGTIVVLDKSIDVSTVAVAVPEDDVLRTVARWTLPPPPPLGLASLIGHTVTAADVSPDGRTLVVRTYDQVLLLSRPDGTPIDAGSLATVPSWPVTDLGRVDAELQGEAVTMLDDGRVVTVAEGSTTITATTP